MEGNSKIDQNKFNKNKNDIGDEKNNDNKKTQSPKINEEIKETKDEGKEIKTKTQKVNEKNQNETNETDLLNDNNKNSKIKIQKVFTDNKEVNYINSKENEFSYTKSTHNSQNEKTKSLSSSKAGQDNTKPTQSIFSQKQAIHFTYLNYRIIEKINTGSLFYFDIENENKYKYVKLLDNGLILDNFKKIEEDYKKMERMVTFKKESNKITVLNFKKLYGVVIKIKNEVVKAYNEYIKNTLNLKIKIQISLDNKNETNNIYYNLKCSYSLCYTDENDEYKDLDNKMKYYDNDILNKDLTNGLLLLITEIKSENYKKKIQKIQPINKENNIESDKKPDKEDDKEELSKINETEEETINSIIDGLPQGPNKFELIKFKKEIGNHNKKTCEMAIELTNGLFMSCGSDGEVKLYGEKFEVKDKVNIDKVQCIYHLMEVKGVEYKDNNTDDVLVLAFSNEIIIFIDVLKANYKMNTKKFQFPNAMFCGIQTEGDTIVICSDSCTVAYSRLVYGVQKNETKAIRQNILLDYQTVCGTKINSKTIALISTSKKDKEAFLKIKSTSRSEKIEYDEIDFSFNPTPCSLLLITNDINKEDKILICACRKDENMNEDDEKNKNGIYLINAQLNDKKIKNYFLDTKSFEVFCFCLLNTKKAKNKKYFLAGGYENRYKKGYMKLYKMTFTGNIEETRVKRVLTVPDTAGRLNMPVSSIVQASEGNNILVTCWDGSVNLYSAPVFEEK